MPARQPKASYPFSDAANSGSNPRSSPLNPDNQSSPGPSPANSQMYLPTANSSSTANLLSPTSASTPRAGASRTAPGGPRYAQGGLSSPSSASGHSLGSASIAPSISDKFSLSADPAAWGTELTPGHAEPDDYLHNPDPRRDRKNDQGGTIFTARGIANLGFLFILGAGLITLFAGYPLITYFGKRKPTTLGGYNLGGVNGSGQVPEMSNHFALVDPDTPDSALHFKTYRDGSQWDLIFSDEFNTDDRTFYPGDDPYWEAVDLHYWGTGDLEWYDPKGVNTSGGSARVSLSEESTHRLNYSGGHVSTWNKFCFTGGYIEVNVSLPGDPHNVGLWPAIWMMGNLGRAGYGASLEGMWPYSYDACDWGTLPNQTFHGLPSLPAGSGDSYNGDALSYLQGQRLSSCTCPGESHPGPVNPDGTFKARSAPEIDIFEATVGRGVGQVSQSGQWAPFNVGYAWANTSKDATVYDSVVTELNKYRGGAYQEATSGLSNTSQTAYQATGGYAIYGVEYQPGLNGYITWINNGKPAWTLEASAVGADPITNISARPIPQEPMYIMMNLGISKSFGGYISPNLVFPAIMSVDYVRVYQDPSNRNVGCSPEAYPTEAYISQYIEAYSNPNLTTWALEYGQPIPKNRLVDEC